VLSYLRVVNFALVREATLEFGPGLNLLTGETGAGKSILVDAFEVLLGGSAHPGMVRAGEERARIEAEFRLPLDHPSAELLEQAGLEGGVTLTLRREVAHRGAGRAFVNDAAVTVRLLRSLSDTLVDLHGQHEHQDLLRPGAALDLLDALGGALDLRSQVLSSHARWNRAAARLSELERDASARAERSDLLRYEVGELGRAKPRAGEEQELEAEAHRLRHAGRLLELARTCYGELEEDDGAILVRLDRILRDLPELIAIDPSFEEQRGALEQARIPLAELSRSLRDLALHFEFNPQRQEEVEARLARLAALARRYRADSAGLLALLEQKKDELRLLEGGEEVTTELGRELESARSQYRSLAAELSAARRQAAGALEKRVRPELAALALERARLEVRLGPGPEGPSGADQAELQFGANPGEGVRPLAQVASGGELSRLSLAIKGLAQAAGSARTLVFDEIDAGIGGAVAEALGRRLRALSARHQILCVTHLAPVAAFADQHFRVHKQVAGGRTAALVERLEGDRRVEELARMVSGADITEEAIEHARALLQALQPKRRD
jgi:DNA repair protein RecN (Recombination protein N)